MLPINKHIFLLFFLQHLVSNIMTSYSITSSSNSNTAAYQSRVSRNVQLPKNTIGLHNNTLIYILLDIIIIC